MSMRLTRMFGATVALWGLISVASAQTFVPPGWSVCLDPATGHTNDYGSIYLNNDIFGAGYGFSGSSIYSASCFTSAVTVPVTGRLGFYVGPTGSVQSTFDDGMSLSFGAPLDAGADWAIDEVVIDGIQHDNTSANFTVLFTSGATSSANLGAVGSAPVGSGFTGRYIYAEYLVGSVYVYQQVDLYGDAVRVAWQLQNTDTTALIGHSVGLDSGRWMAMLTNPTVNTSFQASGFGGIPNGFTDKNGFVVDGTRPSTLPQRFIRATDPTNFPKAVNFDFGQANAYGLRVENGPLDASGGFDAYVTARTPSVAGGLGATSGKVLAETQADEIVLGSANLLLRGTATTSNPAGELADGPLPDTLGSQFTPYNATVGYIQKFYGKTLLPGASRTIVQYYHTTWGVSDYQSPYVATVDAPKLLAYDATNANGQVSPNPMTIRVSVDNTYTDVLPISGIVTLKFPKSTGLSFVDSANQVDYTETVNGQPVEYLRYSLPTNSIGPGSLGSVDFQVRFDGSITGNLPWTATSVMTPPGGIGGAKTISGSIYASATPNLNLIAGPNLISVPWTFNDTAWTTVLGLAATDFTAFNWDPVQMGYVVSTSQKRGVGTWIVANSDYIPLPLGASAVQPDPNTSVGLLDLKAGWNLIANPYNFPITLGQLDGVALATSGVSSTFSQLVNQGSISGSVAYWDNSTNAPSYQYISGDSGVLQPNKGYWIYVFTSQDVILNFPSVYLEWVPGATRALNAWNQSENQWRLQLVARSAKTVDDQNYVGVVSSAKDVNALSVVKPPMAPTQDLSLSVEQTLNGKNLRLAQAYNLKSSTQSWKFDVQSVGGGAVTVTWPNMRSASTNTRFRLVDVAADVSRDMRQTSGYTYTADKNSTRQFIVQATPAGATRAIIGDVVVSRPTRSPGASFAISYSLSSAATTSVRVLSGSGREVFTVTSGRADSAGTNTVSWALRDNANRAVAPGIYRIEIVAETATGDRVRKIVPVNVVR